MGYLIVAILFSLVSYFTTQYNKKQALKPDRVVIKKKDARLDEKLNYIHSEFLRRRIPRKLQDFTLPQRLTTKILQENYSNSSVQELTDYILSYLKLPKNVKTNVLSDYSDYASIYGDSFVLYDDKHVKRTNINTGNENVGLYTVTGEYNKQIHITKKFRFNIEHIVAILVHESIHNFLYHHRIRLPDIEENEILTDVTAIYLGFGSTLLEGYEPIKWISEEWSTAEETGFSTSSTKIGYISKSDIVYVIKSVENIRKKELELLEQEHSLKAEKEIAKRRKHKLLECLDVTVLLHNQNNEALGLVSEKRGQIQISSIDVPIIMENHNIFVLGELQHQIDNIQQQLSKEDGINEESYKSLSSQVNQLSSQLAKWNSVLAKYLLDLTHDVQHKNFINKGF